MKWPIHKFTLNDDNFNATDSVRNISNPNVMKIYVFKLITYDQKAQAG